MILNKATLPEAFHAAVTAHGPRPALIEKSGLTSFDDLKSQADGLAQIWAKRGIGRGDRVVIAMPVGRNLYAALAALWTLGAVAVLPEPAMGLKGLKTALALDNIRAFCASGPYIALKLLLPDLWRIPLLRARLVNPTGAPIPPKCNADDLALISFTSGSTGTPKAIPRSHAFLMAQQEAVSPLLASDTDEIDLVAFPVFALINLAQGRCSALPNWRMSRLDKLQPDVLAEWIDQTNATRALLPPALCDTLARTDIPAGLHSVFTGGGPVFPDMIDAMHTRKPDLRVVTVYGSTEAEPIAEIDSAEISEEDRAAMQAGAGLLAGPPVAQAQVRIEDGEVLVAGPHVNAGYLDPTQDRTTKLNIDGTIWHRTGDAARMDAAGRLWLLGRHGAEVAGPNGPLYPFAIETAARLWAGVRRAALGVKTGAPVLVIEGDASHLAAWTAKAKDIGIAHVIHADIPLDQRHRSKVDYTALNRVLANQTLTKSV